MRLSLLLCVLTLTGCSYTKKIGQVGNIEFFKVQSTSILGPTVNVIVSKPVGSNEMVRVEQAFGGNSIGAVVIGAGGQVGAAAVLRPSKINVKSGAAAASSSEAEAESHGKH